MRHMHEHVVFDGFGMNAQPVRSNDMVHLAILQTESPAAEETSLMYFPADH